MSCDTSKKIEVFTKWRGLAEYEAIWEDSMALAQRFPTFHLEDTVEQWLVGNAVNHPKPPEFFT